MQVSTEDEIVNVARIAIAEGRSPVDALLDNPWPGGIFERVHMQVVRGGRELSLPDGTVVRRSAKALHSVHFDPDGAHFGLDDLVYRHFCATRPGDAEASAARHRSLFPAARVSYAAGIHLELSGAREVLDGSVVPSKLSLDAPIHDLGRIDERRASSVCAPRPFQDCLVVAQFDAVLISAAASASLALRNRGIGPDNVATELLAFELPDVLRHVRLDDLVGNGTNENAATSAIDDWLSAKEGPLQGVKLLNLRTTAAVRSMKQCPALLAKGAGTLRARTSRATWRWSPVHQRVFVIRRRLDDDALRNLSVVIWHYFSVPETDRSLEDFTKRFSVSCPFVHIDARLANVPLPVPYLAVPAEAADPTRLVTEFPDVESLHPGPVAMESTERAITKRRRVSLGTFATNSESNCSGDACLLSAAAAAGSHCQLSPPSQDSNVVDLTQCADDDKAPPRMADDIVDLTGNADEEDAAREMDDLQGALDLTLDDGLL